MACIRVIPRLDIKGPNLVKGIHLEGLRKLGAPGDFAARYYAQGADELIYMDIVASLYGRNSLTEIVEQAARQIFVPMTVGGGVRSVDDFKNLLRCGADKIAVNTAAIKDPSILTDAARAFGSQCVVLSIEAKQQNDGHWEAYTDNGRERTGVDAVAWAKKGESLGAGEILLTSVDREGTRRGFDLDLLAAVSGSVNIPVIASGGAGTPEHFREAVEKGRADAVSAAYVLHYGELTVGAIKDALAGAGREVRA
jgi:cyclase